jgi:hypothetical protein
VAARPEGQSKYTDHKSNKKKLTDKAQHTEGEGHKHKRQNAPHDLYQHMYRTNQQKPPTTSIFNAILFLLKYATFKMSFFIKTHSFVVLVTHKIQVFVSNLHFRILISFAIYVKLIFSNHLFYFAKDSIHTNMSPFIFYGKSHSF